MNTLEEREEMKFVLNGRTFDTASSTVVAVSRGVLNSYNHDLGASGFAGADEVRYENTLHRTAKGSFFLHEHHTVKSGRGKPVVQDKAHSLSASEATAWIQQQNAMVIDSEGLSLPDEA